MHDSRIAATRFASPPRQRFLAETLDDLDTALSTAGARLIVRTGDVYVRRFVPELADLDEPHDIHQPWRCTPAQRRRRGYPPPIVDLDQARDRFQNSRQLAR